MDTQQQDKCLYLIDAYSLIYRSYYAFIRNPRYNSKGMNTSAAFGFINGLVEVINKREPTHIGVAFDSPARTFRNDIYKEYKANREETPEDIKLAVPYIQKIVKAFNIPVIEMPGYEADDIIGTLSYQAEKKGFTTYMMTPDKDYAQLVDNKTYIYKPKGAGTEAEIIGRKEILEKYGIDEPTQVIDIMALWGDTSDNVPGVPGVGEKTAMKLIAEYQNVENLIEHAYQLKGKLKEKIEANKEMILISKKLVSIILDVPVEFNDDELKIRNFNAEALKSILDELEFKNVYERIFKSEKSKHHVQQRLLWDEEPAAVNAADKLLFDSIETVCHDYKLIKEQKERQQLIELLMQQQEICFDTETTSLQVYDAEIVGMSFSIEAGKGWYIALPKDKQHATNIVMEFKHIFENSKIKKVGQNLKFDILMLNMYGINVKGELFDTMIAHYLIQPELRHNLTFLAEQYLKYSPVPVEKLIGKKGKNQLSMGALSHEKIYEYACEDADITFRLKPILEKELDTYGMMALARDIEMPLFNVLKNMELSGVKLDINQICRFGETLNKELVDLNRVIINMAGSGDFNVDSPKQLGEILFEKMKISDAPKMTKSKQYSTSEETLEKLKEKHQIINKILEYRLLKKLMSGYAESLPKLVNNQTNKIHTSFNQTITSTGRLSSNNPNLQNIPIREDRGREIRRAFVPSGNDYIMLSADYSQIELRIMAHMSDDSHLIEAYQNEQDIHTVTAAKIFNISLDQVNSDMRRKAKTANFGIIYGISVYGLSQRLNIPRAEANELIDGYFKNYPGVKEYMDRTIQFARDHGYVKTIMGRRRYLKDITSGNSIVRGMAERNAINAPIQGSASDIIKMAMIQIDKQLSEKHYKTKMILQVHDELVFDVFKPELEEIQKIVVEKMENIITLKVPLTVEAGFGNNWLEAHS